MKMIEFDNVYVLSKSAVAGPMEAEGPLKNSFDKIYNDLYCGTTSFEKAESLMLYDACDIVLRKANLSKKEIDLAIGGDLLNQLAASHYFIRDVPVSFLGMYAACATSSLIIGQGAIWIQNQYAKNVLCFTSSHNNSAERQFRYPNEYGIQKKDTTTYTVTGAGSCILSNKKTKIKVKALTVGEVVDWNHKDANDMGKAMAPAAYETICSHINQRKLKMDDYDLIVTGDLSKIGHSFLCDLFEENGIHIQEKLVDCGLIIYDQQKQNVFSGGSGSACSMCVSMSYLLKKVETGEFKRILIVATGALLSPVMIQQKESIPCIAHAIEYEWSEL